jgi:hypothetical protein
MWSRPSAGERGCGCRVARVVVDRATVVLVARGVRRRACVVRARRSASRTPTATMQHRDERSTREHTACGHGPYPTKWCTVIDAQAHRVLLLVMTRCVQQQRKRNAARRAPASSASTTSTVTTTAPTTATSTTAPTTTTIAPATTPATSAVPAFTGTVATITAPDIPSSYRAGCPVGPDQLRMLHMSYWGFDGSPHVGTMVVNASVAQSVPRRVRRLYAERFPIRRMVPVDAYGGSDPASMDADNTSGFNCRNAVSSGPPHWSAHAYGLAIDVNTVENPYVQNGVARPAAGAAFTDRSCCVPAWRTRAASLVEAFAAVGWQWGGRWSDPDYQHFSATGG